MAATTRGLATLTLVTKHFGERTMTPGIPNYSRPASTRSGSYAHARQERGTGRSSVGSDSSPPGMVPDEDSEDPVSGDDEDHDYHLHQSKLFDSFWQESPYEDMRYPALLQSPEAPASRCFDAKADGQDDDDEPEGAQLSHVDNAWPLPVSPASNARPPPRYMLFPPESQRSATGSSPAADQPSAGRPALAPRSSSLSHGAGPLLPPIASTSSLHLPLLGRPDSPTLTLAGQQALTPPPASPLHDDDDDNDVGRTWRPTAPPHPARANLPTPTTPVDAPPHSRNYSLQLPESPSSGSPQHPPTRGRAATCAPSYPSPSTTPTRAGPAAAVPTSLGVLLLGGARAAANPAPPRKAQIVSKSWLFPKSQDDFSGAGATSEPPAGKTRPQRRRAVAAAAGPAVVSTSFLFPHSQELPRSFFDPDSEDDSGKAGGSVPASPAATTTTTQQQQQQQQHNHNHHKSRLRKMVRGLQHRRSQSEMAKQQ